MLLSLHPGPAAILLKPFFLGFPLKRLAMEAWVKTGGCVLEEESLQLVLQGSVWASAKRLEGRSRRSRVPCIRYKATSLRQWKRAHAKAIVRALQAQAQGHTFSSSRFCGQEVVWSFAESLAKAHSGHKGAHRLLLKFPWLRPSVWDFLVAPDHVKALWAISRRSFSILWPLGIPRAHGLVYPASASEVHDRWRAICAKLMSPEGGTAPTAYWSWASALVGGDDSTHAYLFARQLFID